MFAHSDHYAEEFREQGYTVFRGIVPPALIADLRRQCERGAAQVRAAQGPQAQRFQPVSKFELDLKPFEDYRDLPPLREAVQQVLSPHHSYGDLDVLGVLLEPADEPYCTSWHRDWRDNIPGMDVAQWEADMLDNDLFNQINCALYEDSCTWVVPGSHLRRDTPAEVAAFPQRPLPWPQLNGATGAARERLALAYCAQLPGAQRLLLDAGDFCLYRNTLWHMGNYIPYRQRATLHDSVLTPRLAAWNDKARVACRLRVEAGQVWQNPNTLEITS